MQIWKGEQVPIKAWVDNVYVESEAIDQLKLIAKLLFIFKHIAAMPDMHVGKGATIGSVIPTKGAVIPTATGVDIGCGMGAIRTSLTRADVPREVWAKLRKEIKRLVPHGRSNGGGVGDVGAWSEIPKRVLSVWNNNLESELEDIVKKHKGIRSKYGSNDVNHLGTLGGGNHFIELCFDTDDQVWIMLHSGSRGIGNRIGTYFIRRAKERCKEGSEDERKKIDDGVNNYFKTDEFRALSKVEKRTLSNEMRKASTKHKKELGISLPHQDLAFFEEGTELFDDYLQAVQWAQRYAKYNRVLMFENVLQAVENVCGKFNTDLTVNCHHNYCDWETHFGERILVTRKGAISARKGELGIIPGSMGAKSYIVEGLGNEDSFCSASHGAGRLMSRTNAKKKFTVEDHIKATEGIECAKNASVLAETPGSYKDIDLVMEAEKDLVKPIHELKQFVSVKGEDDDE